MLFVEMKYTKYLWLLKHWNKTYIQLTERNVKSK